jgi:hypothetical protein
MRVNGQEAKQKVVFGPLVFKRGEGQFLAFYAQPVWSYDEFDQLCPTPENKNFVFTREGKKVDDDSPAFRVQLKEYALRKWSWLVLKTLEPSKIEWDQVKEDDPKTWGLVEKELQESLAVFEFNKLMDLVDEANAMSDEKLEANAETFFQIAAQGAALATESSQNGEPVSIKSGDPASDSA